MLDDDEEVRDFYSRVRPVAMAAKAKVARGAAPSYRDVHLIARLHLGLLGIPPVACHGCGVTDYDKPLQAALNWPEVPAERLRQGGRGEVYSIGAETDYIPLCRRCHRRLDSWRRALPVKDLVDPVYEPWPGGLAAVDLAEMARNRPAWNPEGL